MSNTDANPAKFICRDGGTADATSTASGFVPVEIITGRDVPLGGPRAMTVHRTLPQRKRSLIGAWCFADHYGPDEISHTGGMDVAPHPHTGLQTVSWLFSGEVEHRDSGGNSGIIRPGELNLMTSGGGICHSETSLPHVTVLHGLQLWLALPDHARSSAPRALDHYVPSEVSIPGASVRVFLGSLAGSTSPVHTYTPLVGAEIVVDPQTSVVLDVDPSFEHGTLVDSGDIELEGVTIPRAGIGYTGIGSTTLHLSNSSDEAARVVLLGGEPFGEEIVMWWNFVGRSSEEIHDFREQWQQRTDRFGAVEGYVGQGGFNKNADGMSWLPAPALPHGVVKGRKNPAPHARADLPEPGSATITRSLGGNSTSNRR